MTDLTNNFPPLVQQNLTADERSYLNEVFTIFNGYHILEQVWKLMDEPLIAYKCNPEKMD